MKKITPFFILFCILFPVNSQDKPDIDLVQNQYIEISHKLNSLLDPYRPISDELKEIQLRLNNEIEIYKNCEYEFRNNLNTLSEWGNKSQVELYQTLNSKIEKRKKVEDELFKNYQEFISWEINYWDELEEPYLSSPDYLYSNGDFASAIHNYREKIFLTRDRIENFFLQYDSCRMECVYCSCDQLFSDFHSNLSLYELYNQKYFNFLNNGEEGESDIGFNFINYRKNFREYYYLYLLKYSELKEYSRVKLNDLNLSSDEVKQVMKKITDIVLLKMETDALQKHKTEVDRIYELKKSIEDQFYNLDNLYSLLEFQKAVSFMHKSLNPELNISVELESLDEFMSMQFPQNSIADLSQECCMDYLENLKLLSKVISTYEEVPYFCFHAYPQYSNQKVDMNLNIINSRMTFENEGLGHKTNKFVQLTELDLSNSEFSMDLLLKDHKNLKKLDLSNTRISSIEYISDLELEWLDLSNTDIDYEDLQHLRHVHSIQYLDLSNTGIKKMDVNELCYHLKIKKKNCIMKKKPEENDNSILVQSSNTSY